MSQSTCCGNYGVLGHTLQLDQIGLSGDGAWVYKNSWEQTPFALAEDGRDAGELTWKL